MSVTVASPTGSSAGSSMAAPPMEMSIVVPSTTWPEEK
jgi:hypothetical protein